MFVFESNPVWDINKDRIIGVERDSFSIGDVQIDAYLPYYWWRLDDDNTQEVLGYGWITVYEEEDKSEFSLCVSQVHRREGLGDQILTNLEQQIIDRDFPRNIIANVYGDNPNAISIMQLLERKGYRSIWPSEMTRVLISNGQDVTFIKTLS